MAAAPHATFVASFPKDTEFEHPAGATFARALESGLRDRAFFVSEFDNWRDSGWVVDITVGGKLFEVYFAEYGAENHPGWMLVAAPLNQPGLLARLFGRKVPDVAAEHRSLVLAIHDILLKHPAITNVRWCLGGPPEKVPSYESPHELPWPTPLSAPTKG